MTTAETTLDDRISIREVLKGLGPRLLTILSFLAVRLLYAVVTLLLIIFLSFFGLEMARGTEFGPAVSHGLTATVDYVGRLARGDLGTAFAAEMGARRTDVVQVLKEALPRSLGLLAVSLCGATVLGILLGTVAASRKKSLRALALPTILFSLIGVSLPTFFTALLLQIGVIKLTQAAGRTVLPAGGFGWDAHLLLPALVLAARPIAQITRITNVTLTRVLREDFVRTATSKGLGRRLLWLRHIWPNVAIPILTTMGTSLRFSLSSLPVVELYFGWSGIGQLLLRAIARQDDLLTVALAMSLGAIFIVVNFSLEVGYRLLDPRLREIAASSTTQTEESFVSGLRSGFSALIDAVRDLPLLRRWLSPKSDADRAYEDRIRPKSETADMAEISQSIRRERLKSWLRATLGSLPFVLGMVMLIGLLAVYIAGPALSPQNPFNTRGMTTINGEVFVPPYPPSDLYPWGSDALGRDVLSLVLSGAQQTLTLVGLVMLARLAVGFVLGTLAGWQQDRFLDRAIMAVNEIFAALPTLIFAMILVLALGIRQGIWVFVVALCFVGWGEMMQFIRSEVIVLRKQLYVESAMAVGSRFSDIVLRHILPNLLPALISLAALEMGAVAMLLGELGFIGIFIGGGTFSEAIVGAPPYHYSDVPEWGALLSNVRNFARGYPWTAFPPAIAFFLAILAFNLFGEGLRRLVQDVGLSFNRLFNRYTFATVIVLILGLRWVQGNTGSTVFIRQLARAFDRQAVTAQFDYLTDPALESRALGTPGLEQTADYIVEQFKAYGLQPGGKKSTYFFDVEREYFQLTAVPQLAANGQSLIYREDFAEVPTTYFNASDPKSGELVVLLVGAQVFAGTNFSQSAVPEAIQNLDLSDKVVLLLSPGGNLPDSVRQGTLLLTNDPADIYQRDSLSAYSTAAPARLPLRGGPFFYVSAVGADKLLAEANISVQQLLEQESNLGPSDVILAKTGVTVSTLLPGVIAERVPARHVIGYWPGHDENLDDSLIVLLTQYDGLGTDVRGQAYPGANETASGLAVMLELLRSWHEQEFQPKKTIIFVAYVGEGFDRNQFPNRVPDVERFISAKFGFAAAFTPEAFVFLDGVGAGDGHGLSLAAGGNIRLAQLFEESAQRMGVKTIRENEVLNLDAIFGGGNNTATEDAPTITLSWIGADQFEQTPADTPQAVDPVKLEKTGQTLSLALGIMSREVNY